MRRLFLQMCVLLCLSAGAGTAAYFFHPRAPALYLVEESAASGEVTIKQAREWEAKEGVLWIDARMRSEYDKAHIPGALLLNEVEWNQQAFELMDTLGKNTKPVVVYCDAQKCAASKVIADKLRELGVNDVNILRGGWPAWKASQAGKR